MTEQGECLLPFFDSKFIQRVRVVAPLFLHTHEQEQANVTVKQLFNVVPRARADDFQHLPALANDHRLLRFALDINDAVNFGRVRFFLPAFSSDGGRVRQFLAGQVENLFADEFSGNVAFDLIGEQFRIVKLFAFRQVFEDQLDEQFELIAFFAEIGMISAKLYSRL